MSLKRLVPSHHDMGLPGPRARDMLRRRTVARGRHSAQGHVNANVTLSAGLHSLASQLSEGTMGGSTPTSCDWTAACALLAARFSAISRLCIYFWSAPCEPSRGKPNVPPFDGTGADARALVTGSLAC